VLSLLVDSDRRVIRKAALSCKTEWEAQSRGAAVPALESALAGTVPSFATEWDAHRLALPRSFTSFGTDRFVPPAANWNEQATSFAARQTVNVSRLYVYLSLAQLRAAEAAGTIRPRRGRQGHGGRPRRRRDPL